MIKKIKTATIIFLLFSFLSPLIAEDNFFEEGITKYEEKKYNMPPITHWERRVPQTNTILKKNENKKSRMKIK